MAEVVNLRRARKDRERADRARDAAANRAKFGRAEPEKTAAECARAQREAVLDQAKREKP